MHEHVHIKKIYKYDMIKINAILIPIFVFHLTYVHIRNLSLKSRVKKNT